MSDKQRTIHSTLHAQCDIGEFRINHDNPWLLRHVGRSLRRQGFRDVRIKTVHIVSKTTRSESTEDIEDAKEPADG